MNLIAAPATPGPVLDTDTKIRSRETAVAIRQAGFVGVGRYLPLPNNNAAEDVDAAELELICGVGLFAWLIQHPRFPGWRPADHSGAADALAAVQRARMAGYPQRCHAFLDIEGVDGTSEETRVWATSWLATVRVSGFGGGVYQGYQCPMTPVELYYLHNANSYGSDWGNRDVAQRGIAWKQTEHDVVVAGLKVDKGIIRPDRMGEVPIVCFAETSAAAA